MSALPWTIKEKSLWKRLITQFDTQLYAMIDNWMTSSPTPQKFMTFYFEAQEGKHRPKDYGWN